MSRLLTLGAVVALFAACEPGKLLDVEAPDRIPAENLEVPQFAALLVNGTMADFDCALGSWIVVGAILGDELADAQLGAAGWPLDRRDIQPSPPYDGYATNDCTANQTPGLYTPASRARWSADNVLERLQAWSDAEVPKRDSLLAVAAAYAGYAYTILGTAFCSAAVDLGPEMTPAELLAVGEERFSTAIEAGGRAGASRIQNLARLGRARARLYLGKKSEAATDAQAVPAGFTYTVDASDITNRRYNRPYAVNNYYRYYTIEPASRDIRTAGVPDPRTKVDATALRTADGTNLWAQTKYKSRSDLLPVARWEEAQLILAEVQGGQAAAGILNTLRARAGLPALSAAETADLQNTLIEERRKELWLEGQRMYDLIRFNVPFVPPVGAPFDKGGFYGTTRCLPLPDVERLNNPSLK